jgi:hypothetical protein
MDAELSNRTADPATGEAGLKLKAAAGGTTTVKEPELVVVPPAAATLIGPFVADAGTVATIDAAELTVKTALAPLMRTAVTPVKFDPLIVTLVPAGPLAGVKLVIAGAVVRATLTTTLRCTLETCDCASVTVNRTYLVPAPWNV